MRDLLPLKKSLVIAFFSFIPVAGSLFAQSPVLPGSFNLKANPVEFFYPNYNASLEVAVLRNITLDVKASVFPAGRQHPTFADAMPSQRGEGYALYGMVRKYRPLGPVNLFYGAGVLYKEWSYFDQSLQSDFNYVREYRESQSFGINAKTGLQHKFLKGFGVAEVYAGAGCKYRVDDIHMTQSPNPEGVVWQEQGTTQVRKVLATGYFGVNLGLAYTRKARN